MSTKVMVDIETLGLQPSSVILSIGAVVFDISNKEIAPKDFYVELNSDQPGRTCDKSTIEWWMKQEIARPEGRETVYGASDRLNFWLSAVKNNYPGDLEVWANGTDFDITILTHMFRSVENTIPWKYNAVRDYRTLYKLFPEVPRPKMDSSKKHNALEDAKHQAAHAEAIFAHIRMLNDVYADKG